MQKCLFVGGLYAVGFDPSGKFLLAVSHAGRGVFEVGTWERVARDPTLAYPEDGVAIGIGPLEGMVIPVIEKSGGELHFSSPDGKYAFDYEGGTITITEVAG